MNVLCESGQCGSYYVRSGWGRVFEALGHKFIFWDKEKVSAFDAFKTYQPSIFIGSTQGIDRATAKCLANNPQVKVALFASAWGNFFGLEKDIQKVRQEYPIDWATEQEISNLEVLKNTCGKPDFVFLHCTPSAVKDVIGYWESKLGITTASILNAADLFMYYRGKQKKMYECDASYIGGFWNYKGRNLGKYLYPLCQTDLKIKIYSRSQWPHFSQHVGDIPDNEVKHLFASSRVSINISEPHSTTKLFSNYDIVERPYKIFSSGGYCLSDEVSGFDEVFPKGMIRTFSSAQDLIDKIRYAVTEDSTARAAYIDAGHDYICQNHSYFNRVAQMLDLFDMKNEVAKCLALRDKFLLQE